MLVVTAVIGIVATLAVPDLVPLLRRAELQAATSTALNLLDRARVEAIARHRCVGASMVEHSLVLRVGDESCTAFAETITTAGLPASISGRVESSRGAELTFTPTGRVADNGDGDFTNDGGRVVFLSSAGTSSIVGAAASGFLCGTFTTGAPPAADYNAACFPSFLRSGLTGAGASGPDATLAELATVAALVRPLSIDLMCSEGRFSTSGPATAGTVPASSAGGSPLAVPTGQRPTSFEPVPVPSSGDSLARPL